MSITGIPSVMQTTQAMPASAASMDRIGGERRRHEDDRGVGAGFLDRLGDGVEDRHAGDFCPPLPGVTPATTFVPYSTICVAWKRALAPGDALDEQARVFVDKNAHVVLPPLPAQRRNHLARAASSMVSTAVNPASAQNAPVLLRRWCPRAGRRSAP